MAIETYNFSDTGAEHFADIKAWLEANATDYFDGFELSEDKLTLTCKIGDKTALTFVRGSTGNNYVETYYLYNGTTEKISAGANACYIDKIVKTANGIAIRKNYNNTVYNNYTFITKDNKGNTGYIFPSVLTTNIWNVSLRGSSGSGSIYGGIFSSEKTAYDTLSESGLSARYGACHQADTTVLSPICFYNSNGSYTPNLMVTVFGNVLNTECTLEHNGDRYFYNGFVALKE